MKMKMKNNNGCECNYYHCEYNNNDDVAACIDRFTCSIWNYYIFVYVCMYVCTYVCVYTFYCSIVPIVDDDDDDFYSNIMITNDDIVVLRF